MKTNPISTTANISMQRKLKKQFPKIISALILVLLLHLCVTSAVSKALASEDAANSVSTTSLPSAASPQLLAKHTKPAVVQIIIGCQGKGYWLKNRNTYDLFVPTNTGSGYFVHPDGYIVTNAHVTLDTQNQDQCQQLLTKEFYNKLIHDGENPHAVNQLNLLEFQSINLVTLLNGDKFPFTIIKAGASVGKGTDVAIIKINLSNAPVLKLADSEGVQDLDYVIAVGYPAAVNLFNLLHEHSFYVPSFTDGRVSAQKVMKDGSPIIQISAPTSPGNSGGPVINEHGEVIGMVTFGPTKDEPNYENYTFIVPSNTIKSFMQQAGLTGIRFG